VLDREQVKESPLGLNSEQVQNLDAERVRELALQERVDYRLEQERVLVPALRELAALQVLVLAVDILHWDLEQ
jgi:hypothetical protein